MLALGAGGQLGVARTTVFWMVAPLELLVAAGVGVGSFYLRIDPAGLLGLHHTCVNSAMSSDPLHVGPDGAFPLGGCQAKNRKKGIS